MFREVSIVEAREVLRLWLRGHGVRETARLAGVDRKTVRRYEAAAEAVGLEANGDEAPLNEAAVGAVLLALRSGRPPLNMWAEIRRAKAAGELPPGPFDDSHPDINDPTLGRIFRQLQWPPTRADERDR